MCLPYTHMAGDKKEAKESYFQEMGRFYFAPELRSIFTILYLIVFGFFALYYVDNVFLALRFIFHVLTGATALQGTAYLFVGMAFVLSLLLPFSASVYSIFVVYEIWKKRVWSSYLKWIATVVVTLGTLLIVMLTDEAARVAARADVMKSFVEDANLTGRI